MDSESRNSDLKSTETIVPDSSIGDVKIESNGSNVHENVDVVTTDSPINSETEGVEDDSEETESCVSPSGTWSPTSGMKGQGCRKWRRFRREFTNNGIQIKDSAKILKRGSADIVNPSVVKVEVKLKSEGSESSVNGILHRIVGSSTGSDEDMDSKSSTAASDPKPRNSVKDKSGKQFSNIDASKKSRVEGVNRDNENSLSSRESDSRSYSYGFMQCSSFGTNNGGSDRGDCDREQHSDEEVPIGADKSVEDGEVSKGGVALPWKVTGGDKNDQLSGNWDPLVDCVQTLQSTQEALEREIQKFCEVGKDPRPLDDDLVRTSSSIGPEFCVPSSTGSPTSDFGTDIPDLLISLTRNIEMFEKQIEETKGMLRAKETEITELQATVNNLTLSNDDLQRSIYTQQKNYEEIEAEVDSLYKEKVEAEIQYLAIAGMSVLAENKMKLLLTEHNKSHDNAQVQDLQIVENLECKEAKVEKGGMHKKIIAKHTFCCFVQLILFLCVLELIYLIITQFLSKTTVVLPT